MNEPSYFEARPNHMFPPQLTALIRFVRPAEPQACAHCGKKRKKHWTMLVPFHVAEPVGFVVTKSETELPALSPVCTGHMMSPAERFEPAIAAMGNVRASA